MRRGEIWTVSPDPCQGHEQKSWRPVLIVSPDAFNRVTKVPVVVPITRGGGFARAAGFAGIVRCDQPRALNLRTRRARRVEAAPQAVLDEVLARLRPIFD